jgi:hypothetical protein
LAAFNIGVELGQALIVALAVPFLAYLNRQSPALHLKLVRLVAALIAIAGAVWFVQRILAH